MVLVRDHLSRYGFYRTQKPRISARMDPSSASSPASKFAAVADNVGDAGGSPSGESGVAGTVGAADRTDGETTVKSGVSSPDRSEAR